MSFGRLVGVAVLVALLALIPLSVVIAPPGAFEIPFPNHNAGFERDFHATLTDRTGLVRGLAVAQPDRLVDTQVTNLGADPRTLLVDLVGSSCDQATHLFLEPNGSTFVLRSWTERGDCAIGTGMTRGLAISLWEPIDASAIRVESTD